MAPRTILFVHGWSVTSTDTYGALPSRLAGEAQAAGEPLDVGHVYLGRYVSFHDEVRMSDLAFAMQRALEREFKTLLDSGERFGVITHSTGGPVVRTWWYEYFGSRGLQCPMSHLVMLAPANFGSALAQLGKSTLSRIRSWFKGVEPGQGVLDWLEHGSAESWDLNEAWIRGKFDPKSDVFPFVLTGQTITRSLYDHLNTYTGELGSDGVVRVAAANLNATYVKLQQRGPSAASIPLQVVGKVIESPTCALKIEAQTSHTGIEHGIMEAVPPARGPSTVVDDIRRCMAVTTTKQYDQLAAAFDDESTAVYDRERVEIEPVPLLPDRTYIHDAMSLVIFRLFDSDGYPIEDFDLLLTGVGDDPDRLPRGFLVDRQRNKIHRTALTFFLNHDLMRGSDELRDSNGQVVRGKQDGIEELGLRITARPDSGFVHYVPATFKANQKLLEGVVKPHQTALVDIILRRIVHAGTFQIGQLGNKTIDFRGVTPDAPLEE
jgi:hypothetical protein